MPRARRLPGLPSRPLLLAAALACAEPAPKSPPPDVTGSTPTPTTPTTAPLAPYTRAVRVTLDGQPVADTVVVQGGRPNRWLTDRDGLATVTVDPTVVGDVLLLAAHPEARIDGVEPDPEDAAVLEIALVRYDPQDNLDYVFGDPGEGDQAASHSDQCLHCHVTLHEQWFASPHRSAASNPTVHDLYQGIARAIPEDDCGGSWSVVRAPGSGEPLSACVVAPSVAEATGGNGACADCHAPGIDGALGGRDLLEATGYAYDYGVHCDVCHHVADVDLEAAPGTAGRLRMQRPSEPSDNPLLGLWSPLTFSPLPDVVNPVMGAVYAEVFHEARLCGGCHEQTVEGDPLRWPEGLPVHSTYTEWEAGPYAPEAPCQTCHMPPLADVGNAADLYNLFEDVLVGISAGWERPPGTVRGHSWVGPRQPESNMLQLAAAVDVVKSVADGVLSVAVTVQNVGAGHALPTGEPLRRLVLTVAADCDGEALAATGGDAIPDFAGSLERRDLGGSEPGDPTRWPGAAAGERLRVVRLTGEAVDYAGFGPFGDGRFDAEDKGLFREEVVGEVRILAMDGDVPTLSAPLPEGDVIYRVAADLPSAGGPGWAFARLMVGSDGARDVPAFLAYDVASDNRLLPRQSFTSQHRFAASCEDPTVTATLWYRRYPAGLATERGWEDPPVVMVEARR